MVKLLVGKMFIQAVKPGPMKIADFHIIYKEKVAAQLGKYGVAQMALFRNTACMNTFYYINRWSCTKIILLS